MSKAIDLCGLTFGRLSVIEESNPVITPSGQKIRTWKCLCECGKTTTARGIHLKNGHTQSCGCLRSERAMIHCQTDFTKVNNYDHGDQYIIGHANGNREFLLDIEDFDIIKGFCWTINNKGYLLNRKNQEFHRFILGLYENDSFDDFVVDHINHNPLDNRKSNLRICKQIDNTHNSKIRRNNTSGVTGVQWMKDKNKWRASIEINNQKKYLGDFENIQDAIDARREAEEKYFGEYSYSNSMSMTLSK